MVAAPPPPSPAAIVREWSAALNANRNADAAALFAHNAAIIQGSLAGRLATKALAVAFNDSLPCAGTIVDLSVHGDQAKATFVLGHRPKHRCDGPGEKAAALFVVKHGKITFWEQIPVTTTSPPAA